MRPGDDRGADPLRVVVAEDQALLRVGLTRILEAGGFEVIAAVDNEPALVRALADPAVDVAVLDVRMPPSYSTEGLVAAVEARRDRPGFPVLVLSQYVEPLYARELLASGEECLLVGDGATRYAEVFEGMSRIEFAGEGLAYPLASSLVLLAHAKALQEEFVMPWDLQPLYLRKPDAEINWSTREAS